MRKRFFVALVIALALTSFVAVGAASAHSTIHATCANDRAALINALNADRGEDSFAPDGVASDSFDIALGQARDLLITDGCSSGTGGFVPSYRYPGGYPYDFGASTTVGDPTLCQNLLSYIATLDSHDQQQFGAAGFIARLQTCGNTVPLTTPGTLPYGYGGYRCFNYYCY